MDVPDILLHPFAVGSYVISVVGQLGFGWFDPVWGLLTATAGTWFPAVSATATIIIPQTAFAEWGTPLLLASAVLYVSVKLDQLADRIQTYLDNR